MSKERLEEIKKHRDEADNSADEYEFEKINFYNLHVDWLIEQAGRVQELEEELVKYRNSFEFQLLINNSIKKQNKRYKRALEEISNADWNSEGSDAERELDKVTDVAFKALEGEK